MLLIHLAIDLILTKRKSLSLFRQGDVNMAQDDHGDGSQYDFDPPWGENRLFASLEDALTAMSTAEDPITRGLLHEAAISINADFVALHGIDLGPF
jgi:hypothetical protein